MTGQETGDQEEISGPGKCLKQHVQIAVKNAKFHSNRLETGRYIARTVTRSIKSSIRKVDSVQEVPGTGSLFWPTGLIYSGKFRCVFVWKQRLDIFLAGCCSPGAMCSWSYQPGSQCPIVQGTATYCSFRAWLLREHWPCRQQGRQEIECVFNNVGAGNSIRVY